MKIGMEEGKKDEGGKGGGVRTPTTYLQYNHIYFADHFLVFRTEQSIRRVSVRMTTLK